VIQRKKPSISVVFYNKEPQLRQRQITVASRFQSISRRAPGPIETSSRRPSRSSRIAGEGKPQAAEVAISGTVAGRLASISKKALMSPARRLFSARRFAKAATGSGSRTTLEGSPGRSTHSLC
jgi:hypothetical protein